VRAPGGGAAFPSQEIAPGVYYLSLAIVNVYLVGEVGSPWVLVDAGMPGHFEAIRAAAAARYGEAARPEAIILTHGHFDHAGAALALANHWEVPIYVHRGELPYVTGKAKYPPADPTVGGALAFVYRFFPENHVDLGDRVAALPEDGSVPGMTEWRWIPTPGHTPGHICLFRERDRVLITGDAVLTVDMDVLGEVLSKKQRIASPPGPTTYDWISVRKSLHRLNALHPTTVAAGHGVPMSGSEVSVEMEAFAAHFIHPLRGRYVPEPVRFDEAGIVYLPPPVPDPLPKVAAAIGITGLVGLGLYLNAARRRNRERPS
jgi:glyoxylase-like metal-dependent hydrolase (beta-lactamase superfamily II)